MTRRKFFNNIVASVATLVTAYALPLQKIKRLIGEQEWVLNDVPYEIFKPEVCDPIWTDLAKLEILREYKRQILNDKSYPLYDH